MSVADNAPGPPIQITVDGASDGDNDENLEENGNNIPESINNEIHSDHSNRYCTGNVI